jgi:VanZ family protein
MPTPSDLIAHLPRPVRAGLYAIAALVLLYMALAPVHDVPGVELVWDKAEHAVSWMVLTLLGLLLSTRRRWAIPVFALAFGGLIEVLQATLPFGRDGEWGDFAADSVGVATAWFLWRVAGHLGWVK